MRLGEEPEEAHQHHRGRSGAAGMMRMTKFRYHAAKNVQDAWQQPSHEHAGHEARP